MLIECITQRAQRRISTGACNRERAYAAGFRRLAWRSFWVERLAHRSNRSCGACRVAIETLLESPTDTFPARLRPCAGSFDPIDPISDRDLTQLICALRLFP